MAKLSEIFSGENPFAMSEEQYVGITDMLDKDISIKETHFYTKDDKDKCFIRFSYAKDPKTEFYTVTGSSAIVKILSRSEVQEVLAEGTIETKIVGTKSTLTGRPMYKLEF